MKMRKETFKQRKFRARRSPFHEVKCDKCGKTIPCEEWYFVRLEGYYSDMKVFNTRPRHIEKKELLCQICVDPKKVVKSDQDKIQ